MWNNSSTAFNIPSDNQNQTANVDKFQNSCNDDLSTKYNLQSNRLLGSTEKIRDETVMKDTTTMPNGTINSNLMNNFHIVTEPNQIGIKTSVTVNKLDSFSYNGTVA